MVSICDLDRLTTGTSDQYKRAFRWLRKEYAGGFDRTEPLQAFIDQHPSCRGIRGRIVQSLVNRHMSPKPIGPPITITRFVQPLGKKNQLCNAKLAETVWQSYLPLHLKQKILDDNTTEWSHWWQHYIVHTLCASPLKKNLVRAYVTHVYRVLFQALGCMVTSDVVALQRHDLIQSIIACNPLRVHQRRLCRIAIVPLFMAQKEV